MRRGALAAPHFAVVNPAAVRPPDNVRTAAG